MRLSNKRVLLFSPLIAILAAAAVVSAQQTKPQPSSAVASDDGGTVFHSDTRLVVCHTTVVDRNGRLITDLPASAFTVYENDKEQPIHAVKREDVPVSIGLIIDNSGSMRDKRAKVEAAATTLAEESNKDDEVFVVNFNDEPFLDNPHGKDFTSDINEIREALTRIDSRGGTAMRDAIRVSIDHLKEKAHREKKVLVVVTDGNDNSSMISNENLVKASQQSDVLIYAVGLLSDEERREAKRAERALKDLTDATGGECFFPRDLGEVDRIAHQVARDIRSQYTITYTPTDSAMDGTYRRIRVTVNASGHPTVRTRSGYYATPDQAMPKNDPTLK
jgi:Ca-activated chloride channel homolog